MGTHTVTITLPATGATRGGADQPQISLTRDPATRAWERGAHRISRDYLLGAAREKLSRLLRLTPGWDGHRAVPVTPIAAMVANALLEILVEDDGPTPQVQPMPDGGVAVDWLAAGNSLRVEVDPVGDVLMAADRSDGTEEFGSEFQYRAPDGWTIERAQVWLQKLASNIESRNH